MSSNMSYGEMHMMLKGVIRMVEKLNGTSSDAEASSQESPPDSPSFSVEAPSSPSNTEQEDNEVYYNDPYQKSPYTHSLEIVKQTFSL